MKHLGLVLGQGGPTFFGWEILIFLVLLALGSLFLGLGCTILETS